MINFKDNFSKQSGTYVRYRPDYPKELFHFLSTLTPAHNLAWDVGTGNGQAAIALTEYFKTVYASDPSEEQIKNAFTNHKIIYKVETAEQCNLEENSVDLITVAQALHWLNFDTFYAIAKRVLKKDGVIAVWTYNLPEISTEIDAKVKHFHDETLKGYWLYENQLVAEQYSGIPFPFRTLPVPDFTIQKTLTFEGLIGLINSWSAVQRFIDRTNRNPIEELEKGLSLTWGNKDETKEATWKIMLKAGRNN